MGTLGTSLARRDNALNFVRLLLATSVIVWHTYPVLAVEPGWPASLIGSGAVNGFFAISGYLIAGSRLRLPFGRYLWKRFIRIYPGFWVALLITAFVLAPIAGALTGTAYSLGTGVNYVAQNVTLWIGEQTIGQTLTTVPHAQVWNASLWTLFYEFTAYLLIGFALSIPLVRRHLASFALGATVLLSIGAGMEVGAEWPAPFDLALGGFRLWSFFAAGALVYALRDHVRVSPAVGAISFIVLVVTYLAGFEGWLSPLPLSVFLLWLGASLPMRLGSVNDISYGMYVYAFPIQQMLVILLGTEVPPWLFMIATAACTAPFALASWHLVEKPTMRLRFPKRSSASSVTKRQATTTPGRQAPAP